MKRTKLTENPLVPAPVKGDEKIHIPDLDATVWEQGCQLLAKFHDESGFIYEGKIISVLPIRERDRLVAVKVTWRTDPLPGDVVFFEPSKTYSIGTTEIREDHIGQLVQQLKGPSAIEPGFDLCSLLNTKCLIVVSGNLLVSRMLTTRKLELVAERQQDVLMVLPLDNSKRTAALAKAVSGARNHK